MKQTGAGWFGKTRLAALKALVALAPLAAFLGLLCFAGPGAAAEPPAADAQAARAVVEAQLQAFAADDAAAAFSHAAPALRERFGSAQAFMAMVRGSYPVVYRPASVAFLVAEALDGEIVQPVHFRDRAGVLWLATYRLQRQPDRSWRISACQLAESRERTT